MVLEADDEVIGFEHRDRNLSAAAASQQPRPQPDIISLRV
jgi:hypothetical protein